MTPLPFPEIFDIEPTATGERARLAACVNCNFHTREARDAEGNFL